MMRSDTAEKEKGVEVAVEVETEVEIGAEIKIMAAIAESLIEIRKGTTTHLIEEEKTIIK
jgi:hypothetical protein